MRSRLVAQGCGGLEKVLRGSKVDWTGLDGGARSCDTSGSTAPPFLSFSLAAQPLSSNVLHFKSTSEIPTDPSVPSAYLPFCKAGVSVLSTPADADLSPLDMYSDVRVAMPSMSTSSGDGSVLMHVLHCVLVHHHLDGTVMYGCMYGGKLCTDVCTQSGLQYGTC